MTADHYATLGVAPTTEDVVIRAAYLALMRRYHPDTNASHAAAARVRAITAAYKVLGDRDRRADYDRTRAAQAGLAPLTPSLKQFPIGQFVFGLIILLLVPLLAVAMRSSQSLPQTDDHPARAQSGVKQPVRDAAMLCASQEIQDQVKRELFRQAAGFRGGDSMALEDLAARSLIRIRAPAIAGGGREREALHCTATVAIELPQAITAAGRRTLAGDIGYAVRAGSVTAGGAIILADGEAIARQLASLAPLPRAADELATEPEVPDPIPVPVQPRLAEPPVMSKPAPPLPTALPRPKARAERKPSKPVAQPSNENLAALDRHVTLLTDQSLRYGDAAKQAALLRTRKGFLSRRKACRSDSCARDAYLHRMREVAKIMSDQPQPSR